jgi:hypothetical protein
MTSIPTKTAALFSLVASLALMACSSEQSPYAPQNTGTSILKGLATPKPKTKPLKASQQLTRAMLTPVTEHFLIARIEKNDTDSTLIRTAQNGAYDTYFSGDRRALILKDGILTGTHGLGHDLAGLDVPDGILRTSGQDYTRTYRFLNGDLTTRRQTFTCATRKDGQETRTLFERSYSLNKITETCRSDAKTIENQFWVQKNGMIRSSRQWASEGIGYMFIDQLVPN